jgi:hypothetical protein
MFTKVIKWEPRRATDTMETFTVTNIKLIFRFDIKKYSPKMLCFWYEDNWVPLILLLLTDTIRTTGSTDQVGN